MLKKKIAVITARADDAEQHIILTGIAQSAFSLDADISVFTNIYNHWVIDDVLTFENVIYDLFSPEMFDGVIITAEAFMDLSVLNKIITEIKEVNIPAVVIGGNIDGFYSIYSDDEADMYEIAEHLITVHGFTNIDILTGFESNPVSQKRLNGCRKAFEKHNIPFDESRVHFGDFWTDSGEALAEKYINSESTMPQALICTNDFMAYGVCDRLTSAGINIPNDITVTGYDYNNERIYHYPLLTTFQRHRRKMGIDAVNYLLSGDYTEQNDNRFVYGNTCPCGANAEQMKNEILNARIGQYHTALNSVAQLSNKLTLCRTLSEYNDTLSEFFYLLHGIKTLYVCIDKSWNSEVYSKSEYICCKINEEKTAPFPDTFNRKELLSKLSDNVSNALLYYLPLVFQKKNFGYMVIEYDYPNCYNPELRDFIKTAANSLEFLSMKNDIGYLRQCQTVSSLYDALTGFYNLNEFKQIVLTINRGQNNNINMSAVNLSFPSDAEYLRGENYRSEIISGIAKTIKSICHSHELCCRTDNGFIILHKGGLFSDKLKAAIQYELSSQNVGQIAVSYADIENADVKTAVDELLTSLNVQTEADIRKYEKRKTSAYYETLLKLRNEIYSAPNKSRSLDDASRRLCLSEGYFRAIYKNCFDTSYANDCINARIMLAKYLLCTSSMSVYAIAMKCGYANEKFFTRQFRQHTGLSPLKYSQKVR